MQEFYILHKKETILLTVVCVEVVLGLWLVTGMLYGLGYMKKLVTGIVYVFAIIFVTIVWVDGVLGMLYEFV